MMPSIIEPIPRHRALVPWEPTAAFETYATFDPRPPSLAGIAFLRGIAEDIAAALGLPLEEVRSEVAPGPGPA